MRKVIRGFVNGDMKPLLELGLDGLRIVRVYTIIDEHKFKYDPNKGKEISITDDKAHLEHLGNVFLEDHFHDWRVDNDYFHFYGHSGSKGEAHDLLLVCK